MVNKLFTITNATIYIIIIFVSYFLLSEDDLSRMNQIIPFYRFYTKNKSAKLIKDIEIVEPNKDCPEGSSPFLFYKYPGTKKGCLISKTNLEEGSCNFWTKFWNAYDNIEETEEKLFDVLYGKKLCFFPFNDLDYVTNLNNKKEGKLCGNLDNIGNKFYVSNDEECPINKISINKENGNNGKLIGEGYYLHYSKDSLEEDNNNKDSLLTNESFVVSEGLPCINPEEINTYHIQYLLNKANESYICNTFIDDKRLDDRYIMLSSINKRNLYKDNNISLDEFYEYPFKEVNLTLYQLGYIGIDTNFSLQILDNSDKFISDINNITNFNKYNRYITPIIFSFIFLIIVNLIFKYIIADITIYILNFILLAFDIGNLTLNILIFLLLQNFGSLEQYYSNNNKDNIFISQIKYIDEIINKSKVINMKNIYGIIAMIFFIILFDILNCCIFNNPRNHLEKMKKNKDYYLENKKIYNSINVLKPFEDKKISHSKFKREIELSKINNFSDDENENDIINNAKDEEEDILTNK